MHRLYADTTPLYIRDLSIHGFWNLGAGEGGADTGTNPLCISGMTVFTNGGFNTLFQVIDRTGRQKISKNIDDLNSTINQLDTTDIYRTFHLTTGAHTEHSSTFWYIKHNLTNRTETLQSTFSKHTKIKLKISNRR